MTNPCETYEPLHLFEGYGVEMEYMIVDRATLNVRPVTDRLIEAECGHITEEISVGDIAWSNELALHVVELKTSSPVASLTGLSKRFQSHIRRINGHLSDLKAILLPTAMHPWMDPRGEMKLWPHNFSDVYQAFDLVFDCTGHGWANLQSVHLNLPFSGDDEFGRLHAAIRLILPLLPGLAASSPVVDGNLSGLMDTRLEVYRNNSRRVPMVAGHVIPEPAYTEADYHRLILQPLYDQILPHDPERILQDEFLNARGAIARFSRNAIEIRVIDVQECPAADVAILQTVIAVLKALVSEKWATFAAQCDVSVNRLHAMFLDTVRDADEAIITDTDYLKLLGIQDACEVRQIWAQLVDATTPETDLMTGKALDMIINRGPLARRITARLAEAPAREELKKVYEELAECLAEGHLFE